MSRPRRRPKPAREGRTVCGLGALCHVRSPALAAFRRGPLTAFRAQRSGSARVELSWGGVCWGGLLYFCRSRGRGGVFRCRSR